MCYLGLRLYRWDGLGSLTASFRGSAVGCAVTAAQPSPSFFNTAKFEQPAMDWNALIENLSRPISLDSIDWSSLEQLLGSDAAFTILAFAQVILPLIWVMRTHNREPRTYLKEPIVRISSSQAVDMWYQDSRRYLDSLASMAKAIGTAGGLGLAACATLIATSGFKIWPLYLSATMLFFTVAICALSQLQLSHTYFMQAKACARAAIGSDADDQVGVALVSPNPEERIFDSLFSIRLGWWWLFGGWTMLLIAIAAKSIPRVLSI